MFLVFNCEVIFITYTFKPIISHTSQFINQINKLMAYKISNSVHWHYLTRFITIIPNLTLATVTNLSKLNSKNICTHQQESFSVLAPVCQALLK